MTDLTKLADEWRELKDKVLTPRNIIINRMSDQLEAALPKWVKITDDPDTLPPPNKRIMTTSLLCDGEWSEQHIFEPIPTHWIYDVDHIARDYLIGTHWRPLCSIDYPPDTGEGDE